MTKTVKVKRSASNAVPADRFEGCILVPVSKGKDHYPVVSPRVLENTYYRVVKDEDRVRTLVTVMPDGVHVAWDSCARCHGYITQCRCKEGMYHPRSVAWIRATHDVKYPTERVQDYSMYYDPWGRNSDVPVDREVVFGSLPTSKADTTARKRKTSQPVVAPVEDDPNALSISDIQNIDMDELHKAAKRQAKRSVRRARSVIRGGK